MWRMVTSVSADVQLQTEMSFSHFVMLRVSSRRRVAPRWAEDRWRPLGPISDNIEPTDHRHMPDAVRAAHTNQLMSSKHESDLSNSFLKTFYVILKSCKLLTFGKTGKFSIAWHQPRQINKNNSHSPTKYLVFFHKIADLLHYWTFYLLWL